MMDIDTLKAEITRRRRIIEPNLPSKDEFDKIFDRVGSSINTDFAIGERLGAYTMLRKIEDFVNEGRNNPIDYWYQKYLKEKEKNERLVTRACDWLELHDSYSVPTNIQVERLRGWLNEE